MKTKKQNSRRASCLNSQHTARDDGWFNSEVLTAVHVLRIETIRAPLKTKRAGIVCKIYRW